MDAAAPPIPARLLRAGRKPPVREYRRSPPGRLTKRPDVSDVRVDGMARSGVLNRSQTPPACHPGRDGVRLRLSFDETTSSAGTRPNSSHSSLCASDRRRGLTLSANITPGTSMRSPVACREGDDHASGSGSKDTRHAGTNDGGGMYSSIGSGVRTSPALGRLSGTPVAWRPGTGLRSGGCRCGSG